MNPRSVVITGNDNCQQFVLMPNFSNHNIALGVESIGLFLASHRCQTFNSSVVSLLAFKKPLTSITTGEETPPK